MGSFDRIEKQVVIRAPRARVWQAIRNAREFGSWFGVNLEDEFAVGKQIRGTFNGSIDEAAIMEHQRKMGLPPAKIRQLETEFVFCTVEQIIPQRFFSFRWIPYGIDASVDPKTEPTTLVEFQLEEIAEGTLLRIVESGFEGVPEHRRERAFRMNDGGWTAQAENVKRYVEKI